MFHDFIWYQSDLVLVNEYNFLIFNYFFHFAVTPKAALTSFLFCFCCFVLGFFVELPNELNNTQQWFSCKYLRRKCKKANVCLDISQTWKTDALLWGILRTKWMDIYGWGMDIYDRLELIVQDKKKGSDKLRNMMVKSNILVKDDTWYQDS